MNKDVIYIEPEDDITDVISRIKSSSQKIIALVPPKKVGIMRSAVNIKLIAKTAKSLDKAAVIITTDPSLVKLSALSGLPVAKTLSSRPMLPSEFTNRKKQETEELAEKDLDMPAEDDSHATEIIDDKMALDSDEIENDDKKDKKKKDNKLTEKIPNFDKYRKWIVIGGASVVLLTVLLVWMFVFAPYVKITVEMKTIASNISENVTLVTDEKNKNNAEGKFLLEQIKYEEENSVEVPATGKANKGDKAKGSVTVKAVFKSTSASSVAIPAGTTFTLANRKYVANEAHTINYKGVGDSSCKYEGGLLTNGCYILEKIDVTASEAGESYNVEAQKSGTISVSNVSFYSATAMTGGTDKKVTVVDEKDIEDAKSQLANSENSEESKQQLFDQIGDDVIEVKASYKVEIKDEKVSPKKGEEVKDGEKVKVTAKVVYTIYVVDRTAIDEYVAAYEKDKIGEHDRIYSTENAYFDKFLEGKDNAYTAKLKALVKIGPGISETAILELAKGKKIGEAKALVNDNLGSNGTADITSSFPWVRSVPNDPNKVGIEIKLKDSSEEGEK